MKQEMISGIIFIVISLLLIIKPDVTYKLTEKWKTKDGQGPTDSYINTLRVVGIVIYVVGMVLVI